MNPSDIDFIRKTLLDKQQFTAMANAFIAASVEASDASVAGWKSYLKGSLEATSFEYIREVFDRSESPIETTFLNSLLLSFIKNDGLGVVIHPTFRDAPAEIEQFRQTLSGFREFWDWFRARETKESVHDFLDRERAAGKMPEEERVYFNELIFKYGYVPLDNSYHLTLQPKFPNLKVGGRAVRADMYFWIPARPDINVIVECDGFAYHSDKAAFKSDRQRDRELKLRGYDVLRFSGSEIFGDPVNTPIQVVKFLEQIKGRKPLYMETGVR